LLTLLFLEAVGLQRTWDLRGYTGQALALLTDRHRAYGYATPSDFWPNWPLLERMLPSQRLSHVGLLLCGSQGHREERILFLSSTLMDTASPSTPIH
jgi:hypothetical protein